MPFYLFILLSVFLNSKEDNFCSCRESEKISMETIEDYDLIFHGKIQKLETVNHKRQLTFELEKLYKGDLKTDTVTVSSPADLSMCGLNIGTEGEWLVYAFKENDNFSTNSCTRSGNLNSYMDHVKKRVKSDLIFLENLKR